MYSGGGKKRACLRQGDSQGERKRDSGILCEPHLSQKRDYTIIKPRFSAFFQTELDLILRRLGVKAVILTGTTTPNCIRTSCYDGLSLDYNILIIEDCCSSNTAEIQRVNMEDMARVGAVITDSDTFCTDVFAVADFAGEIQRRVQQDETAPE